MSAEKEDGMMRNVKLTAIEFFATPWGKTFDPQNSTT